MLARTLLTVFLVLPSLLAVSERSAAADEEQQKKNSSDKPNIVLVLADDLGSGHLGCYGQQKIQTPHLDRLAGEGLRFTQAYAGSHVCQPSRCVLMTGMHTGHAAVRANDVGQLLRKDDVTIAEVLQQAGYTTGCFGKWGLGFEGTPGHPNRQGFDEFFGQLLQVHAHFYYPYWLWHNDRRHALPGNENGQRKQYVQDEIHARALEFIRQNREKSFFAYIGYITPHVELVVPEDSERPYRGQFPKRAILDTRAGYIGSEDGYATVAGMISRLDAQVGEIMKLLKELQVEKNTIVIFTSDNGAQSGGRDAGWTAMTDFFRGNGSLRGYKGQFYEGGIRVPLIVRWPENIKADGTSDEVCGFWDMLPTLAEAAGVEPPENVDGHSLMPTLTGEGRRQASEGLYWEYPQRNGLGRAARIGPWKAIQQRPEGKVELYNLESDPTESENLAGQHPEQVQKALAFMDRSHTEPRPRVENIKRSTIDDFVR